MTKKQEMIDLLKADFPTLRVGGDDVGYTELSPEDYEATIVQWAEARLAKEQAKIDAETTRKTKISAYQKLGLTEAEIEALLPTPKPVINQTI